MYDPRRLGGLLFSALPIALCLSFGSVLVKAHINSRPNWKTQGDLQSDAKYFLSVGPGRISSMLHDKLDEKRRGTTTLGLVVGASHVVFGIDTELLGNSLGGNWIHFEALGADVRFLSEMGRLIEVSEISPNFIIIGITPVMFHVSDHYLNDPVFAENDGGGRLIRYRNNIGRIFLTPVNFAFPDRERFNGCAHMNMVDWRVDFFKWLGPGFEGGFRPIPLEWDRFHREFYQRWDGRKEGQIEDMLTSEKAEFEPASYPIASVQETSLIKLINSCRTSGANIIVVIMPEASRLRTMMPRQSLLAFDHAIQNIPKDPSIQLVDLWRFLPDDEFIDVTHANPVGCERITKRVIEAIAPLVKESRGPHVLGFRQ
jgi:hypothetical protein